MTEDREEQGVTCEPRGKIGEDNGNSQTGTRCSDVAVEYRPRHYTALHTSTWLAHCSAVQPANRLHAAATLVRRHILAHFGQLTRSACQQPLRLTNRLIQRLY